MDTSNATGFQTWKQLLFTDLQEKLTSAQDQSWTSSGKDKVEKFMGTDTASNDGVETELDPGIISMLADWVCDEFTSQVSEHAQYAAEGTNSTSDGKFDEQIASYVEGYKIQQRATASLKKEEREKKKAEKKAEKEKERAEKKAEKEKEKAEKEKEKLEKKQQEVAAAAKKEQEKIQKKSAEMMTSAITAATTASEKMQQKYDEAAQQETQDAFASELDEWIEKERGKVDSKLQKYVKELYNILANAHKGRTDTLRGINKQLERMITGVRKMVESAKEDTENKAKKLSDSINKQYLEKQQKAAADAAKKSIVDAQNEAARLSAEASTAADSAMQQLQGKLDALMGK